MSMIELDTWLHANDLRLPDKILDGKIHRYPRNGGKDNGWYVGFLNQCPRTAKPFSVMVCGDWQMQDMRWIYKPEGKGWSSEAKAVADMQIKRAQELAEEERRQAQVKAAEKAVKSWAKASASGASPYIERKLINGLYGARVEEWRDGCVKIVVPMHDIDGNLVGLQRISEDGDKRFMGGQKVQGAFFTFGEQDTVEAFLCEGWATGASIHMATERTVFCAFNAGNLVPVGLALKAKYPNMNITVVGDDDRWKPDIGNPGAEKGKKAAIAVQGPLILPRFASEDGHPTDANDLHVREGLDALRGQLIDEDHPTEAGFIPLGYDENTHFFYHLPSKDIVKGTGFTAPCMYQIAPLAYWSMRYPLAKSAGVNWSQAQDDIIQMSRAAGPFDSSRIRGTGVWLDDGRIVVNTGMHLIVNGVPTPLTGLKTWRIYVQSKHRIPQIHDKPLTSTEGMHLVRACMAMKWLDPQMAALLAGWLAIARIAGALPVRPHLWLTGGKGTGKSTLMESLIAPALGHPRGKLYLQGGSTEAGIRQAIKSSSLPIIFDEFESTGIESRKKQEACIELARNSWSSSQGIMLKGSAAGHAVEYQLAFAALFSSIRIVLTNDADRSRFCILELEPHDNSCAQWEAVQMALAKIDVEYGERLFARMTMMTNTVLESQKRLANAISMAGMSQRLGQQFGMLLAGYWCLLNDEAPTKEQAAITAREINLKGEIEEAKEKDENQCLTALLTSKSISCSMGPTITVGQALERHGQYAEELKSLGIRVDDGRLLIASNHTELRKIYAHTQWAGGWSRTLLRLPGSTVTNGLRFLDQYSRAVSIELTKTSKMPDF